MCDGGGAISLESSLAVANRGSALRRPAHTPRSSLFGHTRSAAGSDPHKSSAACCHGRSSACKAILSSRASIRIMRRGCQRRTCCQTTGGWSFSHGRGRSLRAHPLSTGSGAAARLVRQPSRAARQHPDRRLAGAPGQAAAVQQRMRQRHRRQGRALALAHAHAQHGRKSAAVKAQLGWPPETSAVPTGQALSARRIRCTGNWRARIWPTAAGRPRGWRCGAMLAGRFGWSNQDAPGPVFVSRCGSRCGTRPSGDHSP